MSLVTIPQVSAKVNWIQFPSRFLIGELGANLLVSRPHNCARPMLFGSRGSREFPFVSDTSPKCNDQEGLGQGLAKGRITVASCFCRLTLFGTKPSGDEASYQILIKVRKPVINTRNDMIKERDSQKHPKRANLLRQSKRGVGVRVWSEPL